MDNSRTFGPEYPELADEGEVGSARGGVDGVKVRDECKRFPASRAAAELTVAQIWLAV
jgi:hypothetical protein